MYCSNCGAESNKKVCLSCGVKQGDAKRFCKWCGYQIEEKAAICPECGEKTMENKKIKILLTVAQTVVSFFVAFFMFVFKLNYEKVNFSFVFFGLLAILVSFPVTFNLISNFVKKITHKVTAKNLIRKVSFALMSLLFVVGIVGFSVNVGKFSDEKMDEYYSQVQHEVATEIALTYFHDDVALKNESSFVLNSSDVRYWDDEVSEDRKVVKVVLDYSAENSFGGMVRDTYTVYLYFYESDGHYAKAPSFN